MNAKKDTLGRMAVFLLPSLKLKRREPDGRTVEERVHHFLLDEYGGYTASTGTIFGYWRNTAGKEFYGEHREYKVSFPGKDRVPELESFLARLAREIGEESVYLETGEDAWLVYADEA